MEPPRFKLNLDIENADYASQSVALFLEVLAQNPNQEVGNGGIIKAEADNKVFDVVRNLDSYTIRADSVIR